ncbi:carbohydrate ABC transporter permease [Paenibacillus sp. NPDC058071]|uniref:carbohydrate ABC transporter permease n=1 Tax=Paenibacillus sp. NPDC058071 TaxID=3346326 RepID=UPI0036DCB644
MQSTMNARKKKQIGKAALTLLMVAVGVCFLLPFFWMLSASMKPEIDVFKYPIQWIPQDWRFVENYKEVWFGEHPFALYYWNSIKVSVVTTIVSVLVSAMAAFAFSHVEFPGRKALFGVVLLTFMVPSYSILVPQFMIFRWFDLFDSHLGLVFLGSFSALGTFMLRQFFLGLHKDYMDAALIDGAGTFTTFFRIALPLVRPALATYAILRFIWTWNDYANPLIFLRSDRLMTVQIGIQKFAAESGAFYSLIMAGTVSAILPLLIIFVIGQKQVIEGIALGGVKG